MIQSPFGAMAKRVAIVHGLVILGLVVAPFLYSSCARRIRKEESIAMIDLQLAMTTPTPMVQMPQPVKPPPQPPRPEPPKPPEPTKPPQESVVPRETVRDVKPPPPTNRVVKPSEIKISTQLVRIATSAPRTPTASSPALTAEQARKLLELGAVPGPVTSVPGGGDATLLSGYFARVRGIYYDAWIQPESLTGSELTVTVTLKVTRNGTIVTKSIRRQSGLALLDDSVKRALQAVPRLPELPAAYRGTTKEFDIEFKLSDS